MENKIELKQKTKNTETVLLSKSKIKKQLGKADKLLKDLLNHLGIHFQTWAYRKTDHAWPVSRAIDMADWIGCPVSEIQADCSMVIIIHATIEP